jgi:hypothetical protein
MLITTCLHCSLSGMNSLQVVVYLRVYPEDSKLLKGWVCQSCLMIDRSFLTSDRSSLYGVVTMSFTQETVFNVWAGPWIYYTLGAYVQYYGNI